MVSNNNSFWSYKKEINSSDGQVLSDCGGIRLVFILTQ